MSVLPFGSRWLWSLWQQSAHPGARPIVALLLCLWVVALAVALMQIRRHLLRDAARGRKVA